MTALEAGVDELLPDLRQVLHACAQKVDPLPARDLHIEVVFLGHRSECNEFVGRDLSTRNPGDDRIQPGALNIGQESVVRVLERFVLLLEHEVVVHAGEDRRDGWLANLAAVAAPVFSEK